MQIDNENSRLNRKKRPQRVARIARIEGKSRGSQEILMREPETPGDPRHPSSALVPLERAPGRANKAQLQSGPYSPLVAQLVSAKLGLPQSRMRRRMGADYATNTYETISQRPAAPHIGAHASKVK